MYNNVENEILFVCIMLVVMYNVYKVGLSN